MKILFILFGLVFGAMQFILLGKATALLLKKDNRFIIFISLKLILYASAIALMWFLFKDYFLFAGIGLGIGMTAGAFINFIIASGHNKSKGDDAA